MAATGDTAALPVRWTQSQYRPRADFLRVETWRARSQLFLTSLLVLALTTVVLSALTSGSALTTTVTPLDNPTLSAYSGPASAVRSLVGHSLCSGWTSGSVCVTVTSFSYVPTNCHPQSCAPSSSHARLRSIWPVSNDVEATITNSGDSAFEVVLTSSDTSLQYEASNPKSPHTVWEPSLTLTGIRTSTTRGCGASDGSPLVVAAHGRATVCLQFATPIWEASPTYPIAVSQPQWLSLEIGGFALWQHFGVGVDRFVATTPSPILATPDSFWGTPGLTFDVTGPVDNSWYSYQYQQVVGSSTGSIVLGPSRPSQDVYQQSGVIPRGVDLLMIRQKSLSGVVLQSRVTDAYLDVASACSSTGCDVSRISPDWSFDASRVARCRGSRRFTCIPFFLPTTSRVIGGGYNVTFWGSFTRGRNAGVVFGADCQNSYCDGNGWW